MISRNGVHKVRNNSLPQDSVNANRDYIIDQMYPNVGIIFLDMENLKKTGRHLDDVNLPLERKFLDIGVIDDNQQENCHENGIQKKLGKMK